MGVFRERIEVGSPDETRFEAIEAVVDTGASFTTIPASMLRRLGAVPHESRAFEIADGSIIERELGYTWLRVQGRSGISPVIFGNEAGPVLLGAFTLEVLQLGVDPGNQRLVPVPAYLLPQGPYLR
jgi:predicted aspartyl protease